MRAPQEPLQCEYLLPNGTRCANVLSGRGRFRWCEQHNLIVREERRNLGNAGWQHTWRLRHSRLHHTRRWIYRTVSKAETSILATLPGVNPHLLHNALLRGFREAFDPTLIRHQHITALAALSGGYHAAVVAHYDAEAIPRWDCPVEMILGRGPLFPELRIDERDECCFADLVDPKFILDHLNHVLKFILDSGWTGKEPAKVHVMHQLSKITGQPFIFWGIARGSEVAMNLKDSIRSNRTPFTPKEAPIIECKPLHGTSPVPIGPNGDGICFATVNAFVQGVSQILERRR
jgi:hypothetical protein